MRDLESARRSADTWMQTNTGVECSVCGISYYDCTVMVFKVAKACCSACSYTDTHKATSSYSELEVMLKSTLSAWVGPRVLSDVVKATIEVVAAYERSK